MLRRRTRLQPPTKKSPRHSLQGQQYPRCRPLTTQRLRCVTNTSQISKKTNCTRVSSPVSRGYPTPWSGIVSTLRKALIRITRHLASPWIFSRSDSRVVHTRTMREHLLSRSRPESPFGPTVCITPPAAATLINGLLPEDLLRAT